MSSIPPFGIRIDQSVFYIVEELSGRNEERNTVFGRQRVFTTMAEAINFAALIGYRAKRKCEVEDARSDPINSRTFESNQLQGYIYLIAVAETGDIKILEDENFEQCVQLYEEYAFGGLREIEDWVKTSGKPLFERILSEMTTIAASLQKTQATQNSSGKPIIIKKKKVRKVN